MNQNLENHLRECIYPSISFSIGTYNLLYGLSRIIIDFSNSHPAHRDDCFISAFGLGLIAYGKILYDKARISDNQKNNVPPKPLDVGL